VFLFLPRKRLRGSGVTGGLKSIKRNPGVGRFKKIIRTGETTRCGRAEWKSRLSHYLLTIHYWIRYTRLRIPIAESFPATYARAPYVRAYCINKQTRKHTRRPALARPSVIRTCTYTSPRNKPDAGGKGGPCRRVCLENKNASFETCILNSPRRPPSPLPLLPLSIPRALLHLSPFVTSPAARRILPSPSRVFLPTRSRGVSCSCGFFRPPFYVRLRDISAPTRSRQEGQGGTAGLHHRHGRTWNGIRVYCLSLLFLLSHRRERLHANWEPRLNKGTSGFRWSPVNEDYYSISPV